MAQPKRQLVVLAALAVVCVGVGMTLLLTNTDTPRARAAHFADLSQPEGRPTTPADVTGCGFLLAVRVWDAARNLLDVVHVPSGASSGELHGERQAAWVCIDGTDRDRGRLDITVGANGYFSRKCALAISRSATLQQKDIVLDRQANIVIRTSRGSDLDRVLPGIRLSVEDAHGRTAFSQLMTIGDTVVAPLVEGEFYTATADCSNARACESFVAVDRMEVCLTLRVVVPCWLDTAQVPVNTVLEVDVTARPAGRAFLFIVPEPGPGLAAGLSALGSFPEQLLAVTVQTVDGLTLYDGPLEVRRGAPCVVRLQWPTVPESGTEKATLTVLDDRGGRVRGFRAQSETSARCLYSLGRVAIWFRARAPQHAVFLTHQDFEDECVLLRDGDDVELRLSPRSSSDLVLQASPAFRSHVMVTVEPEGGPSVSVGPLQPGAATTIPVRAGTLRATLDGPDLLRPATRLVRIVGHRSTLMLEPPGDLAITIDGDDDYWATVRGDAGHLSYAGALHRSLLVAGLWPGEYAVDVAAPQDGCVASARVSVTAGQREELRLLALAPKDELPYPPGAVRASYLLGSDDRDWHSVEGSSDTRIANAFLRIPWLLFDLEYPHGVLTITRQGLRSRARVPIVPPATMWRVVEVSCDVRAWYLSQPAPGFLWRESVTVRADGTLRLHEWPRAPAFLFLKSDGENAVASVAGDKTFALPPAATMTLVPSSPSPSINIALVPLCVDGVEIPSSIATGLVLRRSLLPRGPGPSIINLRVPPTATVGVVAASAVLATGRPGDHVAIDR